jgi:hypothetical protein
MTSAQKIAKEKFKKAIAYRQKSGVSLKEAFAHIYGKKKVAKKVAKKIVRKKVVKKRIAGPKDSSLVRKELARKGLKMPHGYSTVKRKRAVSGVKKKKITETGILNRIHKVKKDVERLDEAQHKHMIGAVNKHALKKYEENLNAINKVQNYIITYTRMSKNMDYNLDNRKSFKLTASKWKRILSELKTHAKELKKHI